MRFAGSSRETSSSLCGAFSLGFPQRIPPLPARKRAARRAEPWTEIRAHSRQRHATRTLARMNLLEDPGPFYWKWLAVAAVLLVVYGLERYIRTGGLF